MEHSLAPLLPRVGSLLIWGNESFIYYEGSLEARQKSCLRLVKASKCNEKLYPNDVRDHVEYTRNMFQTQNFF